MTTPIEQVRQERDEALADCAAYADAISRIDRISTGEDQVAMDDTEGLAVVHKTIASLLPNPGQPLLDELAQYRKALAEQKDYTKAVMTALGAADDKNTDLLAACKAAQGQLGAACRCDSDPDTPPCAACLAAGKINAALAAQAEGGKQA